MDSVMLDIATVFDSDQPPHTAPVGYAWVKNPDEYDRVNDIVWVGEWVLQNSFVTPRKTRKNENKDDNKDAKKFKKVEENKYWKNLAEKQRKMVSNVFCPEYHVCDHQEKGHLVCTKSVCCDLFFHEGECHWVSPSGQVGGSAQKNGEW